MTFVRRPALVLALTLSAGKILISQPVGRWLALPMLLALVWSCVRFLNAEQKWLKAAVPLVFFVSMLQGAMILLPAEQQAAKLDGRYFLLHGFVSDTKIYPGGGCQARIRQDKGQGIVVLISSPIPLADGSRIEAGVLGSRPSGQRNPGGFDEAGWLAAQGIFLKTKIIDASSVRVIKVPPPVSLSQMGSQLRMACYDLACRMLGPDQAALLNGLLLGDTSELSSERKYDFRQSGLSHLMSVSGANVTYVLLPFSVLLKRSRLKRSWRLAAVLPVLLSFGFITGWQVSVSRAILMTAVVVTGRLIDRRADTANALGLAVLILQLIWPLSPLSMGFWLSAVASGALILGAELLGRRLSDHLPAWLPRGLSAALSATVCAQTAVLPLIIRTGGSVSLAGVLANLPAGPLAGGTTILASMIIPPALILDRLPGAWQSWVLPWLSRPLSFAINLLATLANLTARVRVGRIFCSQVNIFFQVLLILLIFMVFHPPSVLKLLKKGRLSVFTRFGPLAVLSGVLILCGLSQNYLAILKRPVVEVWFFDVGQGDAILIRDKAGKTILIDGGKPDSGYQVLMPALDALAIDRIDLALATHGHDDHTGGLIELARHGRINKLMVPAIDTTNHESGLSAVQQSETSSFQGEKNVLRELLDTCRMAGIVVQSGSAHDTIVLGQMVRLQILHPEPTDPAKQSGLPLSDDNAQSLQILADLAGQRILFTADCTKEVERQLLDNDLWPKADILKVAHHGSRMTTEDEFLARVRPECAVISVGINFYGHPAADTLLRLSNAGCTIYRTDQAGAVLCRIEPEGYDFTTWLDPTP